MKAVVAAFNQEKALVGAFSMITNLRMELFEALVIIHTRLIHLHYSGYIHTHTLQTSFRRIRGGGSAMLRFKYKVNVDFFSFAPKKKKEMQQKKP